MKNKASCIINLKTGFIVDENSNTINMYCDNISIAKETLFESVGYIEEAKIKLDEFINDTDKKIMVLKSRWGT